MGFACQEQVRVDEFGSADAGPISALGQKRKSPPACATSALAPITDIPNPPLCESACMHNDAEANVLGYQCRFLMQQPILNFEQFARNELLNRQSAFRICHDDVLPFATAPAQDANAPVVIAIKIRVHIHRHVRHVSREHFHRSSFD
jgi:hypothetical protein